MHLICANLLKQTQKLNNQNWHGFHVFIFSYSQIIEEQGGHGGGYGGGHGGGYGGGGHAQEEVVSTNMHN